MIDLDRLVDATINTASEVYEPNDAIGLAGLFIIALPAIISAVLAGIALWRQRTTDKKVDDVKADVRETNLSVNCRPTPMRRDLDDLREDLDTMREEQRRGFQQVSRDIGGLREELHTERVERIEGDKRR